MDCHGDAGRLGPCADDFAPYLELYWEDFGREEVYAAVVCAVYVDRFGHQVGKSVHLNGPFEGFNTEFMDKFLGSIAEGGE